MFTTTPKDITQAILDLCQIISLGNEPYFVPVIPDESALVSRCHPNVDEVVAEQGGESVQGWILWESSYWIESEFHTNWRTPDGKEIDITPKLDGEKTILFLPDPSILYEGRMIPGKRQVKFNDNNLIEWKRLHARNDLIRCKYLPDQPFSVLDQQASIDLQMRAMRALTAFLKSEERRQEKRRRRSK